MKITSIARWWGQASRSSARRALAIDDSWVSDPLSHPDLEAMSERELGDLPFNRGYRKSRECAGEQACGSS